MKAQKIVLAGDFWCAGRDFSMVPGLPECRKLV